MLVPPGTPRFPYTTLFRSLPDAVGGAPGRGEEERRGAQRVRAGARSAGAREEGLHRRRRLPAAGCSDDEDVTGPGRTGDHATLVGVEVHRSLGRREAESYLHAPIETRPTDIAGDPRGHAVGEHRPVRGVGRAYDGATGTGPRPRPPPEGARTPWRSPSACATSPARSRSTPR